MGCESCEGLSAKVCIKAGSECCRAVGIIAKVKVVLWCWCCVRLCW